MLTKAKPHTLQQGILLQVRDAIMNKTTTREGLYATFKKRPYITTTTYAKNVKKKKKK